LEPLLFISYVEISEGVSPIS